MVEVRRRVQVYPRSFQDSNGDGVGDLPGITARVKYIADLGVQAVWLSPFYRSPMADFGYDVSDYCDVDPMFGTLADFDALLARAHEMALVVRRVAFVEGQPEARLVHVAAADRSG